MNIGQRRGRTIRTLCSLLGYSRQAFYQQKKASEKQALQDELIIQQVLLIRSRQRKVGTRKLYIMLKPFLLQHNIIMGRDALFRILQDNNLLIRKRKRKVPRTTFSDHWFRKYPNLIIGMPLKGANSLWVSDITYITIDNDFAYLSLVTDAYSRMIVGFYLSKNLSTAGCVKALKMAIKKLPEESNLIHHSDRGCQYCSTEYVEQLYGNNISISMTQNSDPRENAIAERVNGIIKQELLQASYADFTRATEEVKQAINVYNYERLHSSINMLTPLEAHTMTGELKKHWKNYYTIKQKEAVMT
jgi:putative transposase